MLVMIGILLALQVNNWNEERKDRKTEQLYLKSLIHSLETNLETYDNALEAFDFRMKKFDYLFSVMNNPSSTVEMIRQASQNVTKFVGVMIINNSVLEEMIRSNKLDVFDKELRDKVVDYHSDISVDFLRISANLEQTKVLKNRWISSIDYAHYQGKIDQEHEQVLGWEKDRNSEAFRHATNFYMFRYEMLEGAKSNFLDHVELTNKLLDELKNHLVN